jgi:TonB-linked SusC/RagA family outer membrane protein
MYKIYERVLCVPPGRVRKFLFIMKITTFLIIAAIMQVSASTYGQQVTLSRKKAAMEEVFKEIMLQTGYNVLWQPDKLKDAKPVTVKFKNLQIDLAFDQLLAGQPFTYTIDNRTVVIKIKEHSFINDALETLKNYFKSVDIKGRIVDENGTAMAGVTIKVKSYSRSVITNANGEFEIKGLEENALLQISYVGYQPLEIKATADLSTIKMILVSNGLEEVMISTGYQTLPLERSTGSYGIASGKTLSTRLETSILDRLEGTVPGLYMQNGAVTIRGLSTLYGNQQPLYVVDGFPYEGDLNYINPADVLNITILKDAAAASIYGTRAANGVISITTRLGSARKLQVNYNSTFFVTPIPDFSYLNLMNSKEMVDLQQELFNIRHPDYNDNIIRAAQPKAIEALYKFEQNQISKTELDATLNKLRTLDGAQQVKDLMLQKMLKQQHSFSASGGNEVNQFSTGLYFIGNRGYNKGTSDKSVNINIKDQVKVFKWLTADAGISTNLSSYKGRENGGMDYTKYMPYEVLKDENGNTVPWNDGKSKNEIDRLTGLGLLDETFNPLDQLNKSAIDYKNNYFRLQGGFNVRFIEGLNLDVKYQTERGSSYNKRSREKDYYRTATLINDATQIQNDEVIKNIPDGGEIYETRGDSRSYTVRTQLNYDKQFDSKNHFTALIGGEQRAVAQTSTTLHRMGYNDNNLQFFPVDMLKIASLTGTQSLQSTFSYNNAQFNYFTSTEDRYVSVYANAGHTYDNKYNLTGSIRIDNSNLFGTDPKYKYLPLWSLGGSWRLSNEGFMKSATWIDELNLRATYGLSGNVAKTVGPFLQASPGFNYDTGAPTTQIIYPPNKTLRWEKTAVTNLGLDFGILKNRISGSVDVYNRKTTDLLGERKTDPTNAFQTALINYGSLRNKGYELALNTNNVQSANFTWQSRLTYSHNSNKMTEISTDQESVYTYTSGTGIEKVGYPMKSVYNYRYAGLNPQNGTIRVFDKDGNIVENYNEQTGYVDAMTDVNGLVYGGTLLPTYTIGFTNNFTYKQLSLNVMIIANGGNVFRDAVPKLISSSNFDRNEDRGKINFWRKPGDENIKGIMPAPDLGNSSSYYYQTLWMMNDQNTLKADYIKVRDISLRYDFAPTLLKNSKISSAKLSLQVQNPFHWYRNDKGLDPEAYIATPSEFNRTLPVTPVYMVGVDITF